MDSERKSVEIYLRVKGPRLATVKPEFSKHFFN